MCVCVWEREGERETGLDETKIGMCHGGIRDLCSQKSFTQKFRNRFSTLILDWRIPPPFPIHRSISPTFYTRLLRQYSCAQKCTNLKCKYKKSFAWNLHRKKRHVKCWWNWSIARVPFHQYLMRWHNWKALLFSHILLLGANKLKYMDKDKLCNDYNLPYFWNFTKTMFFPYLFSYFAYNF